MKENNAPRLTGFHFRFSDAWHSNNTGYDILLTHGNGRFEFNARVEEKYLTIGLLGKHSQLEQAFDSIGIFRWDNHSYDDNYWTQDGYEWALDMTFDERPVHCNGVNGYPAGFDDFLTALWDAGVPKIEHGFSVGKNSIRRSRTKPYDKDISFILFK